MLIIILFNCQAEVKRLAMIAAGDDLDPANMLDEEDADLLF